MNDLLTAAVMGVVQGLTEFLPVSSTGHLILTEKVLGISDNEFGLRFDAAIHLGTLTAVLIYFRSTIFGLVGAWLGSLKARRWDVDAQSRLAWLLVIGTIPAGLIGAAIESTAEDTFRSPALVAAMLILFSIPMVLAERYGSERRLVSDATPADALLLGLAQSIALIPGVSRSGITISTAMFDGFKREQAAVFTFLLSAPIIAAAGGKQLFDIARGSSESASNGGLGIYVVGMLLAGIVGYLTIAFLLRFLRFNSLNVFVGYRLALGAVILGLVAAGAL